jgi:hypothetical protein
MSYFDEKHGIVLEDGDLETHTPEFIKNFWEWVTGDTEEPKPKFNNPFK